LPLTLRVNCSFKCKILPLNLKVNCLSNACDQHIEHSEV
jgi:hypothetical protein